MGLNEYVTGMSGGSMIVANKFMLNDINAGAYAINKDIRFSLGDKADIFIVNKAADGTWKWQNRLQRTLKDANSLTVTAAILVSVSTLSILF